MTTTSRPAVSRADNPLAFAPPEIDEDDVEAVVEVLRSGWITTGPRTQEFERRMAERVGVRHALAVNSATAALHLALDAIGLRPEDEVIVPTLTFTASAEVVRYFDATPVLVDVDPVTLCLDPEAVAAAITPRTRAIMAVHLGGHAAPMDELRELAGRHGLVVIEDAAHGFPGAYRGRPIGTLGDLAAYSFYATKTITTAEGGMLLTDNDAYEDRARVMCLHGMSRDSWNRYGASGSWRYDVVAPGFKYNMTDMAAALGLSQLAKAERMLSRRMEVARRYSAAFKSRPELQPPADLPHVQHSWHLYILRLHPENLRIGRDRFVEELQTRGIGTSVHFIPLHTFTYYRQRYGFQDGMFPVAMAQFERMLSLPIYSKMSDADVDDVIDAVGDIVERHRA